MRAMPLHIESPSYIYKMSSIVFQRIVIIQGEIIQKKYDCVCYFSMGNPYIKSEDDISLPHTFILT